VGALRGNPIANFGRLKRELKALPISMAAAVASESAPGLTARTRSAFSSRVNVYGDARPEGVNGGPLTLERSGKTRDNLQFVSNGRVVRAVLGTPYAKYLIGKYKVLPNGAMPVEWARYLSGLVHRARGVT